MQASTASACLRKLSDWVNSVSKPQAASRSFMIFPGFSDFRCACYTAIHDFVMFAARFCLTFTALIQQITLQFEYLASEFKRACPLWHAPNPKWLRLLPR